MAQASLITRVGRTLRRRLRGEPAAAPPAHRAAPIEDDLAVFAAYWYRGVSCNPRAIAEKAVELVPGLRTVWVVKEEHAGSVPAGVTVVQPGTPEYRDAIARAKWFVNNVNFPNHVRKRPGQVHVMTHHGTPLKRMGLDLKGRPGDTFDYDKLLERVAKWDYSVSANPFTSPIWERVYPGGWQTLETGYPRNDVLANATPDDVVAARAALGLADGERAVLYAPTHREYETDGSELLDPGALAAALGEGWVVLARQHYLVGDALAGGGRVRDVSAHPSVEELCLAADALVTDYSSIMFDYAVLDRPIVIHAADWDTYAEKRGTYFDLTAEPPGAVARTTEQVAEALRAGDPAPAERAAFRERFCSLEDGRAAERVVKAVWGTA
jgi:CDP-glycerol glycerophosphotransferase